MLHDVIRVQASQMKGLLYIGRFVSVCVCVSVFVCVLIHTHIHSHTHTIAGVVTICNHICVVPLVHHDGRLRADDCTYARLQ